MARIVILGMAALLLAGCAHEQMVPYVPYEFAKERGEMVIRPVPGLATSDMHIYKMMAVLVCYGDDFEYKNGRLLIPKELASDTELLANYYNKADWISGDLITRGECLTLPTQPTGEK